MVGRAEPSGERERSSIIQRTKSSIIKLCPHSHSHTRMNTTTYSAQTIIRLIECFSQQMHGMCELARMFR